MRYKILNEYVDEWIWMFSLTSYRKPFYELISKQLQNPLYFFLIVELKSKLLNVLHIFKIWKSSLLYFSCIWSSFYNKGFKLILPTNWNWNWNLPTLFLWYSIVVKHFPWLSSKNRDVNWYLFWDFVTFLKIYFL